MKSIFILRIFLCHYIVCSNYKMIRMNQENKWTLLKKFIFTIAVITKSFRKLLNVSWSDQSELTDIIIMVHVIWIYFFLQ